MSLINVSVGIGDQFCRQWSISFRISQNRSSGYLGRLLIILFNNCYFMYVTNSEFFAILFCIAKMRHTVGELKDLTLHRTIVVKLP